MSLSKNVSVQDSFLYSSFPCAALRITVLYHYDQKHNTIPFITFMCYVF